MNTVALKKLLDEKVDLYNQPFFIAEDPIHVPHRFSNKQDIEIAGFFAALFAWGNRKSIIASATRITEKMQLKPHAFILSIDPEKTDWFQPFRGFVHRTFNEGDLWHLLLFLHHHYAINKNESLETAFSQWMKPGDQDVENALSGFYKYVFNYNDQANQEKHCRKHIATPEKKSACKRLNMFLRWMVRKDEQGVDFGIWNQITPSQLICPLDMHVVRVAQRLKLLDRKQADWQAAIELTKKLKEFDATDPVKYDYALYGLGVGEKF